MSRIIINLFMGLVLIPVLATGSSSPPVPSPGIPPANRGPIIMVRGQRAPVNTSLAVADTIYLLGGPDRLDGKFQDAAGNPEWHGWTSVDLAAWPDTLWHIADFNCTDLDPDTPDNHAWWCGLMYPACSESDQPGGYGNEWSATLTWTGTVPDPDSDVTVRITAMLNHDTENNYDFLYLQYENQGGWQTLATYDGANRNIHGEFIPVSVDTTVTLNSTDYQGDLQDQVRLRWLFESDWLASDDDCYYPTVGAAQIDLLAVTFDQGDGEFPVGVTETCEPGDPVQWVPHSRGGCGDFAKIWPLLNDVDPCVDNDTPQVAFIDDGVVVPGTGGYQCTTWCYGPGGYIFNPEGGLLGWGHYVRNEIWSPVLQWPEGEYVKSVLMYDVYVHERFGSLSPGVFGYWKIRSTDNPDPSVASSWTAWLYRADMWNWGGPVYGRLNLDTSIEILPNRTYVQFALGAWDVPDWHWGTDGTPAPYFDNVAFKVTTHHGPSVSIRDELDLAQDSFPEIGTIDYADLGANSVRFDTTWLGDQIRVDVVPLRVGAELTDLPRMYYKLKPNPLFDPFRTSGLPLAGFVYGDSTRTYSGDIIKDRFDFDLPDTGFLYPGDIIHYYFEGQDEVGGSIETAILPTDTTGFAKFPGDPGFVPMLYPQAYTMRALPSLHSATEGDQPAVLFWHDSGDNVSEQMSAWATALGNLGYREGVDYDLYFSHGAGWTVQDGLGFRATATQLRHYRTLLYSSGWFYYCTMTDPGNTDSDVTTLNSWLHLGDKNMFLTGDNYVYDMMTNGTAATMSFILNWLSVNYSHNDLRPLIDYQVAPLVKTVSGNPVFYAVIEWFANGGCPFVEEFDAVIEVGDAQKLAEFTDPNGNTGAYPYAAAVYHHQVQYNADVIYLPYDFYNILTPPVEGKRRVDSPSATRTQLLEEVLFFFNHMGSQPATDVPQQRPFTVSCHPNPFNPATKISYHMPERGELRVKIYNVRGELVRTVFESVVDAGEGFLIWDGTDDRDQQIASGVYFYEATAMEQRRVGKLALVR